MYAFIAENRLWNACILQKRIKNQKNRLTIRGGSYAENIVDPPLADQKKKLFSRIPHPGSTQPLPAIQLARLKTQLDLLAGQFQQPVVFCRQLRSLFEVYAYRVYRPGQTLTSTSLVPSYHIPPLVLMQLQTRLLPECQAHPADALALVDILWTETMLEPRQLGAFLLGQLPVTMTEEVLERLQRWSLPQEDRQILIHLLNNGANNLRQDALQKWSGIIQQWLISVDPRIQAIGLQALLPMISDRQFQNLPGVYAMITPLLYAPPQELHNDLQDVLEAAIDHSPVETGFFLRQLLTSSNDPGLTRLARRVFNRLPISSQNQIRSLLQGREG